MKNEQVARGMALLDAHGPADWRERIDLDRLTFKSSTDCVLGQVYGDMDLGLDELAGLLMAEDVSVYSDTGQAAMYNHGFTASPESLTPDSPEDDAALVAAWRAALTTTP